MGKTTGGEKSFVQREGIDGKWINGLAAAGAASGLGASEQEEGGKVAELYRVTTRTHKYTPTPEGW